MPEAPSEGSMRTRTVFGGVSHCATCGCHDLAACFDEATCGPCSWLVVDREAKLGVCSACPEGLHRWNAGDRQLPVLVDLSGC
jgi:hypothetical protein